MLKLVVSVLLVLVAGVALVVLVGGRPHPPRPAPVPLDGTGVEGSPTLRDERGRIVAVNVRAVEPGRLYRASSFPVNAQMTTDQGKIPYPAALLGPALFEFLRARNVRQVVTLDAPDPAFWAEGGYYKYWADQSGYLVTLVRVAVPPEDAYARNERSGLRAGAELVRILGRLGPGDGAVLVHGDTGKDATGVAVAVYEAWRDRGWMEGNTLWNAVTARYLMSNRFLREAGPFAGRPGRCASGEEGYVCPEWLEPLRKDVEFVAKL